jgi:AAA15 family ATPase/GTPase
MKRIKTIKIQNFKAFQKEQVFDIGGKNVLIYGNNGSGKSSLFWALYTFLQSSIKSDEDVQKYFRNFLESDYSTHQTLKNIFMDEGEDAYIELASIDTLTQAEQIYRISYDTINTNNDQDTSIQELNLASDFINYKLLHNFYRASHKQEVNLWPVFERDIFPFLSEGTQTWLNLIKKDTIDVPRGPSGRVISKQRKERYVHKIDLLNRKIQRLLDEVCDNANDFIKENFFGGKDVIRIKLKFKKKFKFDIIRKRIWEDNHQAQRHDNLHIELIAEIFDENKNPQWTPLHRVQSFLNEAQLTRIAIGIRIGALRTRVQTTDFKILVLDDMLISLDLSNRVAVVRMILNKERKESLKFFDSFQK